MSIDRWMNQEGLIGSIPLCVAIDATHTHIHTHTMEYTHTYTYSTTQKGKPFLWLESIYSFRVMWNFSNLQGRGCHCLIPATSLCWGNSPGTRVHVIAKDEALLVIWHMCLLPGSRPASQPAEGAEEAGSSALLPGAFVSLSGSAYVHALEANAKQPIENTF